MEIRLEISALNTLKHSNYDYVRYEDFIYRCNELEIVNFDKRVTMTISLVIFINSQINVFFSCYGSSFVSYGTSVTQRSHTRIFLTSPYGWPTRSQSQESVNNSLVSVNNSSQLADTLKDP